MLRSLIHFYLISEHDMVIVYNTAYGYLFPHHLLKRLSFFSLLGKFWHTLATLSHLGNFCQESINYIHLGLLLGSVLPPLTYMSIFTTIMGCLGYYNFTVSFESNSKILSTLFFLFKTVLAILGPLLKFPSKFYN